MAAKQELELTWIGKGVRRELEPRIPLEAPPSSGNSDAARPARSYHAEHRVGDEDLLDNCLIFGDNLLAPKALEQAFTGVKNLRLEA
jgi:adenine-specific DNA-methyltransferase